MARLGASRQWQFAQLSPAATTNSSYSFQAIALDATGSLFATGKLRGTATFGANTLLNPTVNDSNAFMAKLSNAGLPLAVRQAAGVAPLALYPNPTAIGMAATLHLPVPAPSAQTLTMHDALGRTVHKVVIPATSKLACLPTASLRASTRCRPA